MFGLGNNDEEERFWNFIMFKMPLTDEEIGEATPYFIIILMIIVFLAIIFV